MAKVYIKFNAAVIKEVPLNKDELSFGRKPGNDIVIDNPAISGFHGKIRKEGDGYIVEDLNSTNGLFVNGQRIKKVTLKHKDQIGVARHVLEFIADGTPEAAQPFQPAPSANGNVDTPAPAETAAAPSGPSAPAARVAPMASEPVQLSPEQPAGTSSGEKTGAIIKILAGGVAGQTEIKLKDLVTYIGSADQAAIKIQGLFVPGLAAAISKRPEGYFLKAVKSGYPKVNGHPVNEQILLEHGALIEAGGTNMMFQNPDAKKAE